MRVKNLPKITFFLGFILLVIAYLIPHKSLEFILGEGIRPLGLVSIYINPILGIIGSFISLIKKQWLYLILNLLIIFTFFIIMGIGYGF